MFIMNNLEEKSGSYERLLEGMLIIISAKHLVEECM